MACKNTGEELEEDDGPPTLVDESSDEGENPDDPDHGENHSVCSSIDWDFMDKIFKDDCHEDDNINESSDGESAESQGDKTTSTVDSIPCAICLKPQWCNSYKSSTQGSCRDYCTHGLACEDNVDDLHVAPIMERSNTMPNMCSILMPPEVDEIAAQSEKVPLHDL